MTRNLIEVHYIGKIDKAIVEGQLGSFLIITTVFVVFSSCSGKQRFDSRIWNQNKVDWWMTDIREKIVDDLIESDTLIGMNQGQVIELLGQPRSVTKTELEYLVREKYGNDIDPEYISNLVIELDNEGRVEKCKVEK